MAEIANDCSMSVGNLYRHFNNKHSIMLACLEQQLQEKLNTGISSAAKHHGLEALRAFLQARLAIGHAQFSGTRHLFDLFTAIESQHRDMLLRYEKKVIDTMASIIQLGIEKQQFRHCNAQQTAYDLHQATLRYNHPIILQKNAFEQLRSDLDRLLDLLYSGLQP